MNPELISPAQSQILVAVLAIFVAILGAGLGFWAKRIRGLSAALLGPLVWILWMIHGALTARFGLDSLGLLIVESLVFVALGAFLGLFWKRLGAQNTEKN